MGTSFNSWVDASWWTPNNRFTWQQRYVWWPKESYESKKRIWLKRAWYGTKYVNGPAGQLAVKLERWLTDEEYMWNQLTNAD